MHQQPPDLYSSFMARPYPKLRTLRFGSLDASEEAIDDPELLTAGYYDFREAAYRIAQGDAWYLSGIKGSGKTAAIEHLNLLWRDQWDKFFRVWNLQEFPIGNVALIQTGETAQLARSQSGWEYLLLLRLANSILQDEGAHTPKNFRSLARTLGADTDKSGDIRSQIVRWSKTTAKVKAPIAELAIERSRQEIPLLQCVEILKKALSEVRTDTQHIVALDGLDQFFFEASDEWNSLAGLVHAISSMNRLFRSSGQRISVVAAIRSDILDILPSSDSNKFKPHVVYLNWNENGIGAENRLWDLIQAKLYAQNHEITDFKRMYLSNDINFGPYHSIPECLLDYTRLLPRDAIAMMRHLQEVHPGAGQVTEVDVKETITRYSDEYFQGEVFNSLAGILDASRAVDLAAFRDALRTTRSRFFSFNEIVEEVDGQLTDSEVKKLLKQLFEVGAIGIRNSEGRGGDYTDFTYRKLTRAGFTTRHGFMLHNALTRAWNRPWK